MAEVNKDESGSLSDVFDAGDSPSLDSSAADKSPESTEDAPSPETDAPKEVLPESKDGESKDDPPSKPEETADGKPVADKKEDKPVNKEVDKKDEPVNKEVDATLQKRFEDTRNWATQLNQQNGQMRQVIEQQAKQLEMLQKKVDGTWTDEDEAKLHQGEATEDVATRAVNAGKVVASRATAIREAAMEFDGDIQKGTEKVMAGLDEFNQLFGNTPHVLAAVHAEELPVQAALDVVERFHFQQKYGAKPKDIRANLEKEIRGELEKSIRKQVLEEIRAGKKSRDATPQTLADVPAGGNRDEKIERSEKLEEIFG